MVFFGLSQDFKNSYSHWKTYALHLRAIINSWSHRDELRLKIWTLRLKAHKVIWEIVPYIRAQFAFKLSHANFPTCINCLHATAY